MPRICRGYQRQQVGDVAVMREQLQRLVELATGSRYPWISLRVAPFSAEAVASAGFGSFSVLRFEALHSFGVVHLNGAHGGICLEQPEDAFAYGAVVRTDPGEGTAALAIL
jgi:hypothetical protein